MTKWTWIVSLVIGATWSLLLLPWVQISETALTGAELSDLLPLLPGLSVLMLLIALYRRGTRLLQSLSAATLLTSAFLSFTTDFRVSPASIQAQEALSGLAGGAGLATQTINPTLFGLSQIVAATLCIVLLSREPKPRSSDSIKDETDPRGIWESQT